MKKAKAGKELAALLEGSFGQCFSTSSAEHGKHPGWLRPLARSQPEIGWEQIFHGRFSKRWPECHESSLRRRRAAIGPSSSGIALARRLMLLARKHAHGAREARNEGRHGEAAERQREKKTAEKLREVEMWQKLRGKIGRAHV